jgi:hypothetical protein
VCLFNGQPGEITTNKKGQNIRQLTQPTQKEKEKKEFDKNSTLK